LKIEESCCLVSRRGIFFPKYDFKSISPLEKILQVLGPLRIGELSELDSFPVLAAINGIGRGGNTGGKLGKRHFLGRIEGKKGGNLVEECIKV
jgi:hypothetical protein